MSHMEFNIAKSNEDQTKIIIRVGPSKEPMIDQFCVKYKSFLMDAQQDDYKLKVLFDLRQATLPGFNSARERLQDYFGREIHSLSEKTLSHVIVVVPNPLVKKGIELIFNLFPSTVETKFLSEMPKKKA